MLAVRKQLIIETLIIFNNSLLNLTHKINMQYAKPPKTRNDRLQVTVYSKVNK